MTFSTLSELLLHSRDLANKSALGFKENGKLKTFSNKQFFDDTIALAAGLKEIGFKKGNRLAIFCYQSPIWLMVDFATLVLGGVSVPVFYNVADDNLEFQLRDSGAKFVFVDKVSPVLLTIAKKQKIKIITYKSNPKADYGFKDLVKLGKKSDPQKIHAAPKPKDLATIIYTSGTTGQPKGVEITHANLVSQIKGAAARFPLYAQTDSALSFLPLAHVFEQMVVLYYFSAGVSVYFVDDPKNLLQWVNEVRPSLMTVIPRALEKLFANLKSRIEEEKNPLKKLMAKLIVKCALKTNPECGKIFIERFFYAKIKNQLVAALGGKMRMMISGGAALNAELERFYLNIGMKLFIGYGLTETSPVIAANCEEFHKYGTVGKPFPGVEVKLAADGELLASGTGIMRGYHKNKEATDEVLQDGWFKTGDLAKIDDEGFVQITGRKKEMLKTSTGKYVSPVPIEQKLMQEMSFLIGAIVIANGRKFTSCLLFADFDQLAKAKAKLGKESLDDKKFLVSEDLNKFARAKIDQVNQGVNIWEQIKKFRIITDKISIETGEITPSLKLRRELLEKKYEKVIGEIYQE